MDNIIVTCIDTITPAGFICETAPIFSAGEMFISLLLLIGLVFAIIVVVAKELFNFSRKL